jgi:hypothetical protein
VFAHSEAQVVVKSVRLNSKQNKMQRKFIFVLFLLKTLYNQIDCVEEGKAN